jgi:hypothetical protein
MGSLIILSIAVLALAAVLAGLLWTFYPSIGIFAGPVVSGALARTADVIHFEPSLWWPWFVAVLVAVFVVAFVW